MPSSGSWSVGDGVVQVWVGVSDGGVSGGQDTGTAGYIKLRKESLVCFFTWKINTWITLGYTVRLWCMTAWWKAECTCLKKGWVRRAVADGLNDKHTHHTQGLIIYFYISDIVIGSGQGAKLTFYHPANGELRKYWNVKINYYFIKC